MIDDKCSKCNRLLTAASKRHQCSRCKAWFCPSCMDRYCLFCKGEVQRVQTS